MTQPQTKAMTLDDVRMLVRSHSTDVPTAIQQLIQENEAAQRDFDSSEQGKELAKDPNYISLSKHKSELARASRRKKQELWKKYYAQPTGIAEQLKIAEFIEELYDLNTDYSRRTIIDIAQKAGLKLGVWGGLKRVFKKAEERFDAVLYGALAAKFDMSAQWQSDFSIGTIYYLRRRAWRFYKMIAKTSPSLYVPMIQALLSQYTANESLNYSSWIFSHVVDQQRYSYSSKTRNGSIGKDLYKNRAFSDLWKKSQEPLLSILETAENDWVAQFAIQSLKKDFPDVIKNISPKILERLAYKDLPDTHEFLIELFTSSPDYHQSKLKSLGLHDAVLELLASKNKKAALFAVEYARAFSADVTTELLLRIIEGDKNLIDAKNFAVSILKTRPLKSYGLSFLVRLFSQTITAPLATTILETQYDKAELSDEVLKTLFFTSGPAFAWASAYLTKKTSPTDRSVSFWLDLADDSRAESSYQYRNTILFAIQKFPLSAIPTEWLLKSLQVHWLQDSMSSAIQKAESLPGLDIERVKGFIFDSRTRQTAFAILKNPKLASLKAVTLSWWLALVKRQDQELHEFAKRYVLEHVAPTEFSETGSLSEAFDRLYRLAVGPKEAENTRAFAQLYLRCHHVVMGKELSEAKEFGVKPKLEKELYTFDLFWPLLKEDRDDVRHFGVAIVRTHLRTWNALSRVYELGDSEHREVRQILLDSLLKAGDPSASKECTFTKKEFDSAAIFALTESRRKATREAATELIRREYESLGGAEKLSWLMQSADREVRLFAVRILWERHRVRNTPSTWKPKTSNAEVSTVFESTPFTDDAALIQFLRRIMLSLPAGASAHVSESEKIKRKSTSVIKTAVLEVVRDFALEDGSFAAACVPLFLECIGSINKGERETALSALAHMSAKHSSLTIFAGGAL